MSTFPAQLHVLWNGVMPYRHAHTVLEWALQHPRHAMHIWVETHQVETQLDIFLDALQEAVTVGHVDVMDVEPLVLGNRMVLYQNGEERAAVILGARENMPQFSGVALTGGGMQAGDDWDVLWQSYGGTDRQGESEQEAALFTGVATGYRGIFDVESLSSIFSCSFCLTGHHGMTLAGLVLPDES